ncbi:MAG TPA: PIN domain-containing protein [Candidatus Sulfotelmatobacter sp.]|nr:PIN domain-containing protein [Candidatus Sulfotelmatobacter sp.]
MRWFFDTSVLIPVFMEDHQHHEASLAAFVAADKKQACCAAHSLAELYSVLTRLPGNRLSGEQVFLFLEAIEEHLSLITLDSREYYSAIREAAGVGIVGGMLYDALLARCARKAAAEVIYTWNLQHFRRLGPEIAKRIKTP